MCNCGTTFKLSTSTACSSRIARLKNSRNKMATLQNSTKDLILKDEFRVVKEEIDNLIQQSVVNNQCPSQEVVVAIENEVNNEYAKYNNN